MNELVIVENRTGERIGAYKTLFIPDEGDLVRVNGKSYRVTFVLKMHDMDKSNCVVEVGVEGTVHRVSSTTRAAGKPIDQ